MVTADIFKVPSMSSRGSQYLLVILSKWHFARAEGRKNHTNTKGPRFYLSWTSTQAALRPKEKLESYILLELCKAFGVTKSHTTPYHAMADGLVERIDCSLLNLLYALVKTESDWEEHVQLLLFVYRTTKHSTTTLSLYEILFRQNPATLHFTSPPIDMIHDPHDYSS